MKILLAGLLFVCLYSTAQENQNDVSIDEGIKWIKSLNWEQVKEKAKKENKYIFVDCYTTWCGPCKRMDKEVYIKDRVGDYMNDKFINVKLQMDKTKNDNPEVQRWYDESARIQDLYKVTVFPSYLFFNSDGQIIHRDVSYVESGKFLEMAAKAFDPKSQYYTLKAEYENGRMDYSIMKYLISKGEKFQDREFVANLKVDYLKYLEQQTEDVVFSKGNIDFIASVISNTKSKWFNFFYKEGERINKIMGQSGFARRACDSAIAREYISPVLNKLQPGDRPNWKNIYSSIEKAFGVEFAKRNIIWRKAQWSLVCNDKFSFMKLFIELEGIGGLDTSFLESDIMINGFAYNYVFAMKPVELQSNLVILNSAIKMMERVVERSDNILHISENDPQKDTAFTMEWKTMKIDTYASLLFRAGRKEDAIKLEEKALQIANAIGDIDNAKLYQNVLEAMIADKL